MRRSPEGKKLGVVATHLRPAQGFGGVVESTSALIANWRKQGRDVLVVTSNGSVDGRIENAAFERELEGPVVTYFVQRWVRWGFGIGAPYQIAKLTNAADATYISGIATWPTTIAAIMAVAFRKPFAVALRGGLTRDHWKTIRSRKPLKYAFYRLLTLPTLRRAKFVHVTSQFEAEDARAIVPGITTVIAPNALSLPGAIETAAPASDLASLKLLFLGRLAPEKAILEFCTALRPHLRPGDSVLIAGAPDGEYGRDVIRLCETMDGFSYIGILKRSEIRRKLQASNMLILPSGFGGADVRENFGNVVVEALSCGRPVLVSSGLAWDSLEESGVGVLVNRDGTDLGRTVEKARNLVMEPDMHERCVSYSKHHFSLESICDLLWSEIFNDSSSDQRRTTKL